MELILLQVQIYLMFSEHLQYLRNVVAMFDQVPMVDEDVIDVDDDKTMEDLPEHLIHEFLDYGR